MSLIKKIVGSVWVLENEEAVAVNADAIKALTRRFMAASARGQESSALRFVSDGERILELNRLLVESTDRTFLLDLAEEIKRYGILKFFHLSGKETVEYFTAVIDIPARPGYVAKLNMQLGSARHMHGLSRSVVKHLWSVSLLAFLLGRDRERKILLARAGLYHDITLKENGGQWVVDFSHPRTAGAVARMLYEPESIAAAVEEHLSANVLRLKIPRSRLGWYLLAADCVIAATERAVSIGLKLRRLVN